MPDANDMDLVREFVRNQSEAAFTELVRRHVNLVYSIARRCTGSDGDAEDVAQAVFVILARKAAGLRARTVLAGWLAETTRFTAACVQRTNARRHAREQEAYMQSTLTDANTADAWARLAPHLEAGMGQLGERDRTLLTLRFYENKSGPEAAALLGLREAAVHKRTARALEKLRKFFTQRGIELSAATIAGAVAANSVQAAPAGLAAAITAAALSGTALTTTAFIAATKAIAMTTIQKTLITTALIASVGAGIYEAKENANARAKVQTLQQQQAPLAEQIQQLQTERDKAASTIAGLKDELAKNEKNNSELLKLRSDVGLLRQQANELRKTQPDPMAESRTATAVIARWLDTDTARNDLTSGMIAFARNHNNQLPTNFADLRGFFPADSPSRFIDADKFDFMVNTPMIREAPAKGGFNSGKIFFREHSPRQKLTNINGVFDEVRIYGFTDGTVAEISANWLKASKLGSFSDWEQNHMVSTQ